MKRKLPQKLIPIDCGDKDYIKKDIWNPRRDLLNLPCPVRAVFIGNPSCGKSTAIKNILLRTDYDQIDVCHFSSHDTVEYDDIDCTVSSEIPSPHDYSNDGLKKLLIIEDFTKENFTKDNIASLSRLFGYTSSHKNLSIFFTCQSFYDIPKQCRRLCNLFVIFKIPDLTSLKSIGQRVGLSTKNFTSIFEKYINQPHDSLWIDMTKDTPAPYRINGYLKIGKK